MAYLSSVRRQTRQLNGQLCGKVLACTPQDRSRCLGWLVHRDGRNVFDDARLYRSSANGLNCAGLYLVNQIRPVSLKSLQEI